MQRTLIAAMLMTAYAMPQTVWGIDKHTLINTNTGQTVFQVNFYDPQDGSFYPNGEDGDPHDDDRMDGPSPRALTQLEKGKLLQAVQYWADIIKPSPNGQAAVLNIGTHKMLDNAQANSYPVENSASSWLNEPSVAAALQGNPSHLSHKHFGADGFFYMGSANWDTEEYVPSLLPRTGKWDTYAVALHETAHTLGISSMVHFNDVIINPNTGFKNYQMVIGELKDFDAQDNPIWAINKYTSFLHDDNGKQAKVGQVLICNGCIYDEEDVENGFDLRKDQGYLKAKHITDVLQDSMPGIPVRIGAFDLPPESGVVDNNAMSHTELKNSLMSHQRYRNYTTLMEAEVALLQDLGYDLDRRNLFGSSVYGSHLNLSNEHGFFKRNAAGNDYLEGQYNTSTLGMGLHVYGSHNHIKQQADLLTIGAGAAGIRVDGENNTITINPATKVHANGLNGRGIMFAYGKNHHLIQQGEVKALGEKGIALSMDFGNNPTGNDSEYRGSWIRTEADEQGNVIKGPLLPELQGSLLKQVDISGTVHGKQAALYISPNALVDKINVLNGANIQGDILSEYHQYDDNNKLRTTEVNFGYGKDAKGQASSKADQNFSFSYSGNIKGLNNLVLSTQGGKTHLNGQHELVSVNVAPNTVLAGNSTYTLNRQQAGIFRNQGTVSPGNSFGSITIKGDYQQTSTGNLEIEVDNQGKHDTLNIIGKADLDGMLTLKPLPAWYDENWSFDSSKALSWGSLGTANLTPHLVAFSPTLNLNAQEVGQQQWRFTMNRAHNAYSQYALNDNQRALGMALYQASQMNQNHALQPILQNLDFSDVSGKTITQALNQLSPEIGSMLLSHGLKQEQTYTDLIYGGHLNQHVNESDARVFIIPMGQDGRQKARDTQIAYDSSGFGVLFGVENTLENTPKWTVGVHAALSNHDLDAKDYRAEGKSRLYSVGVHTRYQADAKQGMWANAYGRLGYAKDELSRNLAFADYQAKHDSSWSGWNGALGAQMGHRFALSNVVGISPVVSLDYTHLQRSAYQEKGAEATRLSIDGVSVDSLRTGLGVQLDWNKDLSSHRALKGNLGLTWRHELLNSELKQQARFVAAPAAGFTVNNRLNSRDSFNIQAGVSYQFSQAFSLGAQVSHDWYQAGGRDLSGQVSAVWAF